MKVRHKQTDAVYSFRGDKFVYISGPEDRHHLVEVEDETGEIRLFKRECIDFIEAKPIPTDRWQDVTEACEETARGIRFAQEWAVYNPAGYRFRRVSLEELSDAYYKTIKSRQAAQWFAFIVEREMEL